MAPRRQANLIAPARIPASLAAGLDEAGRGCLAGPVVAAAVILPDVFNLPGLADSKKLTARGRERLAPAIKACSIAWGLGVSWPARIEEINILNASLEAMAKAASVLRTRPELLLLDGNRTIPAAMLAARWLPGAVQPAQRAIVGGDARLPAISAASILAKTWRDRLMAALGRRWPGYGFEKHKGYGTREHLAALRRLGPCPAHRPSFRGVLMDESPCLL